MTNISFEASPDARRLADRLKETPHGETVTIATLSEVIGRDVRMCRHLVYSAMKIARKEVGAIFGSIRGEGYQRLRTEQLPGLGATTRAHIRRSARRTSRNIVAGLLKANDVPNDVQISANRELSVLGLIEVAARDDSITAAPDLKNGPLPIAKTAADFMKKIGAER